MKNEEVVVGTPVSYLFIRTSNFEILPSSARVPPRAADPEAKGVWWLPRSSKPLFRRGSVEGLVRFRRASATTSPERPSGIPPSPPPLRAPRPSPPPPDRTTPDPRR